MTEKLRIIPMGRDDANAWIEAHHRHHGRVAGHKFAIAAVLGDEIVGMAIVARPKARELQDGVTCEVVRLATLCDGRTVVDGRGREHSLCAASFLYARCARAAQALGFLRIGTYILKGTEKGISLKGAGWRLLWETKGRSWNCRSRPRVDKHPTQDKLFFGAGEWA